ncbi:DUF4157 domain-containing protein [Pseudomonadota bacterium]
MNAQEGKVQKPQGDSMTSAASQKQSDVESTCQFVDNRTEAIAQRKLKALIHHGDQVSQLRKSQAIANSSPQAKQTAQLQAMADHACSQQREFIQKKGNNTGLPDDLKTGMENLSGMSLDDVKVHRNSDKPSQLQAHAYAQGADIYLGSGQEKHLPHELGHVVQQKQGKVKPTMQLKGRVQVNDDERLEREADVMGVKALQMRQSDNQPRSLKSQHDVESSQASQLMPVTQLQLLPISVTGVTHLVEMVRGSIMEGVKLEPEVSEGDTLQIDTGIKFRSRRGPNQEVFKETDREGKPHYRWFQVTKVNGADAPADSFIRDETFTTLLPEALGSRPAKIGDSQRDRVSLSDVNEHGIAANIIAAAEHAPGRGKIEDTIGKFKLAKKPAHNPFKAASLMRICFALSRDKDVAEFIKSDDLESLKKVVNILKSVSRQIIQVWRNPKVDIEQRGDAWPIFTQGLGYLDKDKSHLYRYMTDCLDHNKGYAQTYNSVTMYLSYKLVVDEKESFTTVLNRALAGETNMNIWVGGMAESGKYSFQLKRTTKTSLMESMLAETQEKNMWGALLSPIVNARFGVGKKDWLGYTKTIIENKDELYNTVRALVPSSFALHKRLIESTYTF